METQNARVQSVEHRSKRRWIITMGILLLVVGVPVLWIGFTSHKLQRDDALVRAVQRNDTQAVLSLLDAGADPNAPDETGHTGTPFQKIVENIMARQRHQYIAPNPVLYMMLSPYYSEALDKRVPRYVENPVIVKALLDHGADSNTQDLLGTNVLMLAAMDGYDATVRLLLERGASPTRPSVGHFTPMMFATGPCVETLIARGADPQEGLEPAIGVGDVDALQTLLRHGVDVNARHDSETPLMSAAMSSAACVRILLAHGAKTDLQDKEGMTALMYAIRGGVEKPEAVQALLAAGADYKLKNREGNTALQIATLWRRTRSIALLRKAGATE